MSRSLLAYRSCIGSPAHLSHGEGTCLICSRSVFISTIPSPAPLSRQIIGCLASSLTSTAKICPSTSSCRALLSPPHLIHQPCTDSSSSSTSMSNNRDGQQGDTKKRKASFITQSNPDDTVVRTFQRVLLNRDRQRNPGGNMAEEPAPIWHAPRYVQAAADQLADLAMGGMEVEDPEQHGGHVTDPSDVGTEAQILEEKPEVPELRDHSMEKELHHECEQSAWWCPQYCQYRRPECHPS
ncbi:hypothetical protein DL93DRAFT_1790992 [Clavulina sp. PMI_390]|nr:hypothetical protein DL93DRAFT_1790992 [Clavulina sp. PMI_390]